MAHLKQLRIIGGSLRSRLIEFDPLHGIRPTANRVRETLFNWLSPIITESSCLDLFAGSGALGFEALSRGASFVLMNDRSPKIIRQLQKMMAQLKIPSDKIQLSGNTIGKDLKNFKIPSTHFDIVFIDPPFGQDLIAPSLALLLAQKCIDSNTLIYIEAEKTLNLQETLAHLAQKFKILKKGVTSQTIYFLLQLDNHE